MAKAGYVRTAKTTFDNGIGRLSAGDCRLVRAWTDGRRRGASLAWASSVRLRERREGEAGIALARRPPNQLDGIGEIRYMSNAKLLQNSALKGTSAVIASLSF